jgi:hypothetical protein
MDDKKMGSDTIFQFLLEGRGFAEKWSPTPFFYG